MVKSAKYLSSGDVIIIGQARYRVDNVDIDTDRPIPQQIRVVLDNDTMTMFFASFDRVTVGEW